jgi:hypothetical protein
VDAKHLVAVPEEEDIPRVLAPAIARHDLMQCSCEDGLPCLASQWEAGCLTTEAAAERLSKLVDAPRIVILPHVEGNV